MVSGKLLCPRCSRNEVLHRVRKNMSKTGINLRKQSIIIAYPEFYKEVGELLSSMMTKLCLQCDLNIKNIITENYNRINLTIRSLILRLNQEEEKIVVLPFTADFFEAYLIYSSSELENSYLSLFSLVNRVGDKLFLLPLYNTPLTEMMGFSELTGELKTGDEVFDAIFLWLHDSFKDNEVFHTFPPSIQVISSRFSRCKMCGALIKDGEYCKLCSKEISPGH
ncbi:hypothetical protein [Metallosphaera tengchongensis]|nr:hypothetical protein [Metallosphaera tengchongensis]